MRLQHRSSVPRYALFLLILIPLSLLTACSSSDDGPVAVDPVALAAITDLSVTRANTASVTLNWTSPVALSKAGLAVSYDLRYTTAAQAAAAWDDWTIAVAPAAHDGTAEPRIHTVSGLTANETYLFDLRATNGGGIWSEASNRVMATAAQQHDRTPPGAVRDLQQWGGTATSLTVAWTAARDDDIYGEIADQELRYATEPITAETWAQAAVAPGAPQQAADVPGMLQLTLGDLTAETDYYFAVVAVDDEGQTSDLSNVLSATTGDLNVIRVYLDGSGDYPNIENAIHSAVAGDLILVGPGRYTWTNQGTGDPILGMINVRRDQTGFEVRSMAGPELTILDAERNGGVMSVTGGSEAEPKTELERAGITISGFTFTQGAALDDGGAQGSGGGGLSMHLTDTVVRNCIFRDNEAIQGGAVWVGGRAGATLEDCLFEDNLALVGGAVVLVNSIPTNTVRRCTIRNNRGDRDGGGILAFHCSALIEDCVIVDNSARDEGGGLYVGEVNRPGEEPERSIEVRRCTIVGNQAGVRGSGISLNTDAVIRLENTVVAFNTRTVGLTAIAVSVYEMSCTLVYGNDGDGLPSSTVDLGGNLFEDPQFCDLATFRLGAGSPCLPANQGPDGCGLIGALAQGCTGP
jgi:hypothetical protein